MSLWSIVLRHVRRAPSDTVTGKVTEENEYFSTVFIKVHIAKWHLSRHLFSWSSVLLGHVAPDAILCLAICLRSNFGLRHCWQILSKTHARLVSSQTHGPAL